MFKRLIFVFTSHSLFALTTLHVTVATDDSPGTNGNTGDLRYCLNTMNQNLQSVPDDYAIVFDFPMTIQLNGILPLINNSSNPVTITIGNPGSTANVTIDGNSGAYSGFFIPIGNVTLQNMILQNLTARGGTGGDGISGGGGGLGAGGAIYAPLSFLNGSNPAITLMNVSISDCSAIGGNGGSYFSLSSPTGDEGGGGGGGFSGNGGSITTTGSTGGGGGGGFGGDGGNVVSASDLRGGGGGGGGGLGSRATIGSITNLGTGGDNQDPGVSGSGYGLTSTTGGAGAGGYAGGTNAGGGGGGNATTDGGAFGGGGGGSAGQPGLQPEGNTPPGGSPLPSGGLGGDGGGGGGGGIVITGSTNNVDGQAGAGGYGGGGGGGAGVGASGVSYTVQGGSGGTGGGGGGGGVDQSGLTSATGGSSGGGGGGGGGGPSNSGSGAAGGSDTGSLGGGTGGTGANSVGSGLGGGGGGGGSGLGGAIFVDGSLNNPLNVTIQPLSGIPTTFNTSNTTVQVGTHGTAGSGGGSDGTDGSALGNSIFLRTGSSLTFSAPNTNDLLILGTQVSFVDDTSFGGQGTNVYVKGNGTVIYNGNSNYQGSLFINNATFEVNGTINEASISVCRNLNMSSQRGTLSGTGTLNGTVFVNSGEISPTAGGTLTLGGLTLQSANAPAIGSLVHIDIDTGGSASSVLVTGPATLAGILEIALDPSAVTKPYTILTANGGITGTFDSVSFTEATPEFTLAYLPLGAPTFVQFDFLGLSPIPTTGLSGNALRVANYLNANGANSTLNLLNSLTGNALSDALNSVSPARNAFSTFIEGETAFSLSQIVNDHTDHMRFSQSKPTRAPFLATLVADASDTLYFPSARERETWAGWVGGFVEYAQVDASLQNPSFHFFSDGVLVGLDYYGECHELMGGALGYAHTHFHDAADMGDGQINAYFASLYGNAWIQNIYLSPALWGIFNQSDQKRLIAFEDFSETAQADIFSWLFVPHLEIGCVKSFLCSEVIPFIAFDWVVSWQRGYTEHGASPFNAKQKRNNSSLLRGEAGFKFWEKWRITCGTFSLKEKLSYVCEQPFGVGAVNAAFVGTPNSFSVVAVQQTLNLATVGLDLLFTLGQEKTLDIQLGYEGEFGSSYWSHEGILTLTKHF